ncbi:MAG: phosphoribosylformylglycinamidine synthase I [Candidatus Omnitrophota bacterium]|jgi:phosphoribosylformylglycinamidine synthase I
MSKPKVGVVVFPGSNCDQDCLHAIQDVIGYEAIPIWHKESDLGSIDALVLPGGFSYGDYLRAGAIARFSPVMKAVVQFANSGKPVIGICNGFQVLLESGLLPGAMLRNSSLNFECSYVNLRVESVDSTFTQGYTQNQILRIPVAHGEGSYVAEPDTLKQLNDNQQVLVRYVNADGVPTPESNPNGSLENIAGICNQKRNVFGLMPHPERASEVELGSVDGYAMLQSLVHEVGV